MHPQFPIIFPFETTFIVKEESFTVHEIENLPEQQEHLDNNREYFSKQCTKVFGLLMEGKRLTVLNAITEYGVASLPRRLKDLKENGVHINDEWIIIDPDKPKIKVWFMSEETKVFNRKFFKKQVA